MRHISKDEALTQESFHSELEEWYTESEPGAVIGDARKYGGKAWVWVRHLGNRYHLNADTTYEGVGEYLALLREQHGKLSWSVVENERGVKNKVALGPGKQVVPGFYLYRV